MDFLPGIEVDYLYSFVLFMIPGAIISLVIDKANISNDKSDNMRLLRWIIWSCFYNAIKNTLLKRFICSTVYWMIIDVCLAIIIGVIVAKIVQSDTIERIFDKLNIDYIHHVPTAWDKIWKNQEEQYLTIHLLSGEVLHGGFSEGSFASSIMNNKDVYLSEKYLVGKKGQWELDKGVKGFYIPIDRIDYIEFKEV